LRGRRSQLEKPAENAAGGLQDRAEDQRRGKTGGCDLGFWSPTEAKPWQKGFGSSKKDRFREAHAIPTPYSRQNFGAEAVSPARERACRIVHNRRGVVPLGAAEFSADGRPDDALRGFGVGAVLRAEVVFLLPAEDGFSFGGLFRASRRLERALLIFVQHPGGDDAADDACSESAKELHFAGLPALSLLLFFALLAGGVSRLAGHAGS
jgi:hypothetical protein